MPLTLAQLKDNHNTIIREKVAPDSITTDMVADILDNLADRTVAGWKTGTTVSARNAFPAGEREWGMVYVVTNDTTNTGAYRLEDQGNGSLSNNVNWVRYDLWKLVGTDLMPISTSYNVGIGGTPENKFEVQHLTGKMYFDGQRLSVYNLSPNFNILIGENTGLSMTSSHFHNIGIGTNALRIATGSDNVAMGESALRRAFGSRNTALGYQAALLTEDDENTMLGYFAGVGNNGENNIAIGAHAGNFDLVHTDEIDNTEIVIGTSVMTGSGITAFISAAGLVVGQKYPFFLIFNGTIPTPYIAANQKTNGTVTDANTITLNNASTFTSQGTGTTTLNVYNKQNNSIAIGHDVQTEVSNEIKIGNDAHETLKVGQFIVDLTITPNEGDVLTFVGGKFIPQAP